MSSARVLLAGGPTASAAGWFRLLEAEVDLVGVVEDGRTLLRSASDLAPDVIVADISLPLLNGLEATRQLKKDDPGIKIVLLAVHSRATLAKQAFQAGACGYVLQQRAAEELLTAVREVHQGRSYLTPRVARKVLRDGNCAPGSRDPARLTSRQREVLQLIAEGRSAKQAAAILGLSARTIEFHRYRIMKQLDLHSTAELTRYAIKYGVIALDA